MSIKQFEAHHRCDPDNTFEISDSINGVMDVKGITDEQIVSIVMTARLPIEPAERSFADDSLVYVEYYNIFYKG